MSQWNNSYAYNNQYEGANTWNGDLNNQYNLNQSYYNNRQYDTGNQYVSFDEFLSQMQGNNAGARSGTNFNNDQYHPVNQLSYQNMPSSSQNAQLNTYGGYGPNSSRVSNTVEGYQGQEYNATMPEMNPVNEMIFKSNLTPTAIEFVPKTSVPATSSSNVPAEPSALYNEVKESKSGHGSSTERNWRERPQNGRSRKNETQQQGESSKQELNNYKNPDSNAHSHNYESNHRNNDSNNRNVDVNNRSYDSGSRNQEPRGRNETNGRNYESGNRNQNMSGRNYDSSSRNQESSGRNYEGNGRDQESGSRNYESNNRQEASRNYDVNNRNQDYGSRTYESSRNQDTSGRNYDPNSRYQDTSSRNFDSSGRNQDAGGRNQESNSRNQESNRTYESNRNQESGSRNYDSNRYNDRGQSKSNSKSKGNKDSERTFYNSGVSKGSQDVRIGRESGGRSKNWVGSQRVRPVLDRNIAEDEQYANSYLQHREEKTERMARAEFVQSPSRSKNKPAVNLKDNTDLTQRERLSEQLDKGTLECLVCCERVKQTDSVWSCSNCYHVLHLRCIRKWAMSSIVEGKWRCPACQNTSEDVPTEYRCMCGGVRNPDHQRGASGAHTCGKACKRQRSCPHPCALPCHPGPCPLCMASITKQCGCGAESRSVMCSSKVPQVCGRVCGRELACGVHRCAKECHEGPCDDCTFMVTQVCYCAAEHARSVACTRATGGSAAWACGAECARVLACGAHVCRARCHPPPCPACALRPAALTACPCGNTQVEKGKRDKCTDPVPLCGNICAKPLACGPAGDKHFCKVTCHLGDCPPCPDKTLLQCRCGHSSREVPCEELPEMLNNVLCQRKCNKKLSCGRHRCRSECCASASHRCAVVCGRLLACQLHRCEDFCHTGRCPPCPRVSFEDLTCECGQQVVLPPVRCGTRPPPCQAPCRRARACGHPAHHACHAGACPPCVVLTTKMCHGRHEERKTIPCSQEEFSCGMPCGKPLPCGKHTCIKTCHTGPCDAGKCTQPCNEKRPSCGHPCAAACHSSSGTACPSAAACRRAVRATCPCGRRAAERACADNAKDLAKIMTTLAATKMQEGGSVDLSDVQRPGAMLKTLECDDECRVEARTQQMALALQIRNPDVSAKLAPRYSDHVRATAAKEPSFAHQVHDRLTDLVQLAKKSKQKTRAHSFPSMNWQKRQFIHELCEHFGCESVAYDAEPNRNVVATADREKSWLPAMSVLEVLAREAGKRRVPGPMLRAPPAAAPASNSCSSANKSSGWATLTSTNAWAARSQARQASTSTTTATATAPTPASKIDYFDNPPDN